MRHYLLVEAFLLVSDFSKWPPMNIVLMCYTFGEIREMEKNALIHKVQKQALMLN